MSIENLKKNQENSKVKTSKRERRKKLSRFKDTMHRNFGTPQVGGFGEGKPSYCCKCGERIYKIKTKFNEEQQKWLDYCERCS